MIVVADDDKVLTHLLTRLLEDEGYEVCVAFDGESAYEKAKDPKCKGMLLDIRMPNINGAELLMLMAAEGSKVPVVVMAGFPDFDEEEMKQFPNVKKLLHKPLDPADVVASVRQFAL
ncbi:MAG: response regulator [Spartobacteria bacterium]|nr:response regulator [Spartobacteria bacterium]